MVGMRGVNMSKFKIQDNEYIFPYHYLPEINGDTITKKKQLFWAHEYMSYIKYVADKVKVGGYHNVLDVGCGDGRFCKMIHEIVPGITIRGIDLSQTAIGWAKMFNPEIDFEVCNILDEKRQWEAITCIETIEHIPDDQINNFFKGLSNALQKDGTIYITVPSDNVPVSKKHYRHYNFELLEKQLKNAECGLKIVSREYIVPNVTPIYPVIMRLSSNKFWDLHFLDRILWRKLWRNGLAASARTASHCYAELKHR